MTWRRTWGRIRICLSRLRSRELGGDRSCSCRVLEVNCDEKMVIGHLLPSKITIALEPVECIFSVAIWRGDVNETTLERPIEVLLCKDTRYESYWQGQQTGDGEKGTHDAKLPSDNKS